MNNEFMLQIGAYLETKGVKVDYEKLKKEINSDKLMAELGMDTSTSKQQIRDLASEIHKSLDGIFKNAGVNDFKISVKDVESIINGSLKKSETDEINRQKELAKQVRETQEQYKKMQSISAKNQANNQATQIKEANSLLKQQQSEYQSIWNINEKITKLNPDKNSSEIASLQQEKKYHQENYLELQKQISTYSGVVNNQEKVNTLLEIGKQKQLEINTVQSEQSDKSNDSNLQKQIAQEKELYLAKEEAYKMDQKLADSTSIVSTRANTASKNFETYQKTLNPSILKKYSTEVGKINTSFKEASSSGKQIDLSKANSQLSEFKSNMKNVGAETKTFGSALKSDLRNFAQWTASATILMSGINAIKNIGATVISLDKNVTNLAQATGNTRTQAQELLSTYIKMGEQLGATGSEVAESADSWLRQGKSIKETNELIKDSMVLSKVGQLDSADATQYLTSAMKGYKVEAKDALGIVDKLSAVDINSATSVSGLAEGMSKVANMSSNVGVSMDKLLSYLATVGEVTQKDMGSIGEAFQTMFSRMGNIKLGKMTDDNGESLNDTEGVLKNLGISLRDSKNSFRDFSDVLDDIGKRWTSLSQVEQNALGVAIAGKRMSCA